MKLTAEESYDILSLKTTYKPTKSYKIDRIYFSKPILDVAKKNIEQSRGPQRTMEQVHPREQKQSPIQKLPPKES